ncbi:DNA-binding response regulator, NarL/FixJ family, contains REC and HTH domains [Thermomonospora echinospora]|uniref:DNA-binding response regulator, NarL/FixJ family, contains REC and HTH domains n=1 Tax=Thermomonospora echinospora TaxID=1992 RepID=A0A1H5X0B2_9ACTN|nr:response regulator transcription factor [Thermomonospora echinospora]SEG05234.1 DNA-binding response regulator, NarL/FixJ family, contains REC and HTH domains [Thermomonospora echinospora]
MGIRVVVVDAHTLSRHGLAWIAERQPDVEVVGEAGSLAQAVSRVAARSPQVVTVAARLPDGDGLGLVRALRARDPELGAVVLGPPGDDEVLFAAMDAGASAYVTTTAPAAEIAAAIRHAAVAPGSFTSAGLARALARRRTGGLLSPRERQVLTLLMEGRSIAAIASTMHLSHSTAKTYTARLYEKLGAANRTQAVMAALRLGLVRHDLPVPPPRLPDVAGSC